MAHEQPPASSGPPAGEASRSANQPAAPDPALVPPSPAHADSPGAATGEPDHPAAGADHPAAGADRPAAGAGTPGSPAGGEPEQVGGPQRSLPDVPSAPGTSAAAAPVEGVHTPAVGPGGRDVDTADRPVPGRTAQSRQD